MSGTLKPNARVQERKSNKKPYHTEIWTQLNHRESNFYSKSVNVETINTARLNLLSHLESSAENIGGSFVSDYVTERGRVEGGRMEVRGDGKARYRGMLSP